MRRNFREKYEIIITEVFEKSVKGESFSAETVAMDVIDHFKAQRFTAGDGLTGTTMPRLGATEADDFIVWAAERYFELGLNDLRLAGKLRDHKHCEPSEK
jgi:hypothetical protein